ncbi:CBS domain-containing protein [Caulobacter sp. 17J80-11]|uniref:CBS domain-containing protein n=1 Tax=Caulobacter sp. 17J80-11 TaxID=2763502 RepID=UPI0016537048|nr:CBS domain-containing protein [Caulobacter sp. 17J80-11]MBC6983716.1 CBS domain-containing protein [Caulobacter sp. 17J80-11]
MLVTEILKAKGDEVFTCAPDISLQEAARELQARKVGALLVLEKDRVVGIFSERDVVRAVADDGAPALERPVRTYMTKKVLVALPTETVDELMGRMTDRRVRHLPVMREEKLCGIVSIGDLVKSRIAETVLEAETLKHYIVHG